jgi:dsDNA-specific endonuclease/ATPase MutS2
MHDYWIGDRVWIASLQRVGTFEGQADELAIIRIGAVTTQIPFEEISILEEKDEDFLLQDLRSEAEEKKHSSFDFPDSLDLHVSELSPRLENSEPAQIIAHQRNRLREFLREAIKHRKQLVTIIHGKGEGVLRSEVLKILSEFEEVTGVEHESHGGAVVVKFG